MLNGRPRRLLFQVYNRRGLGHLMRSTNLAREIRRLAPEVEVAFHTRAAPPKELQEPGVLFFIDTDWRSLVGEFVPNVVIYDTVLPRDEEPDDDGARRRVFVMRRCKPGRQRAIFNDRRLERIDRILIPHSRDEFGYELPRRLVDKTAFVGPIVRRPATGGPERLRRKYGLEGAPFVITSTPGSGGFQDEAAAFFDRVLAADARIRPRLPGLRHLLIKGPRYAGDLPAPAGVTVVDSEPELVDLLALSDVAITAGGYNTVNEVRLSKTPAIFLPSPRTHDDQQDRVERMADLGLGLVVAEESVPEAARRIAALVERRTSIDAVRRRLAVDRPRLGNRRAASQILRMAG